MDCLSAWDVWNWSALIYLVIVVITFIPVLVALLKKVQLKPGGAGFDLSPHFTNENKELLEQHYSRIKGTLVFWKNQAEKFRYFHNYTLYWSIPISILIPVVTQSLDGEASSKLFLTIMSTHIAIIIALHRGLRVEKNYKAFRQGESEFYDLRRRFLDNPSDFGENEKEQIVKYFKEAETIRKNIRNAETDNFPTLQEIKGVESK